MSEKPRLELGRVVMSAPLAAYCEKKNFQLLPYIARHERCDWGDVCKEDWALNDKALTQGTRVVSEYSLPDGKKIFVITEADRSATTLLFPEDY